MKSLDYFANDLLDRVKKKFDNVIIVDSAANKGIGKTTWTIQLSKKICEKINYNYSFDLIIFNPTSEKIIEKVKNLPEGCPIHIDESSRVAYKRDFQKEFSKNLIKFINICRKFGKIVIFNNPDFWDLDKDLRNLADYRVTILRRGIAQVRGKYANPEVSDKWLRKESMEIIDSHIKSDPTNIGRVIYAIRKTSNFLYEMSFDELPVDEFEEYEKLSKTEELKGMEEKNPPWELRFVALCAILINAFNDGRLNSMSIAQMINSLISIRYNYNPNADYMMIASDVIRQKIHRTFVEKGVDVTKLELNNNNNSIIVKNGDSADSVESENI